MIQSAYQIDFLHAGQTTRLLDFGEPLQADLVTATSQAADPYAPIGAAWGESVAKGAAATTLAFSVLRRHASHAALRDACNASAAAFPGAVTGALRVVISGGTTWRLDDVTYASAYAMPRVPSAAFESLTAYAFQGGKLVLETAPEVGDPVRLPDLPGMDHRMVLDADGYWLEVGFATDFPLTGSAATGWTGPAGICQLELQASTNLLAWTAGGFVDCPGSPIDAGGGEWHHWARAVVPVYWQTIMLDLAATTDRYGKSVTAVSALGVAIDLPGYPYPMPAAAATLQADLRSAGFTAALVTASRGQIVARVKNHTPDGAIHLAVTMDGDNVTDVAWNGSTIPLAGYPFAMPSGQADLQAALRAAGQSVAVVTLYGDALSILLPDRSASGNSRPFSLTISPGDPYPIWDGQKNYLGLTPADGVLGTPGNIRTPAGLPLVEALKQFSRMKLTIPPSP